LYRAADLWDSSSLEDFFGKAGRLTYVTMPGTKHFFVDPKVEVVALVFCQHLPFDPNGLFTRFRTAVMQAVE